jgi:hypothetical protein
MARSNTIRKYYDLSAAQDAQLDAMIARYKAEVGKVLGLDITISQAEFIRALLRKHAQDTGQTWPDDYPTPGGRRRRGL